MPGQRFPVLPAFRRRNVFATPRWLLDELGNHQIWSGEVNSHDGLGFNNFQASGIDIVNYRIAWVFDERGLAIVFDNVVGKAVHFIYQRVIGVTG